MSRFNYDAPPPTSCPLLPTQITPATALANIEAYLSLAEQPDHAHLHPDCQFFGSGPSMEGRPLGGGRVLQQLRRVAAGLRGERLGAEGSEGVESIFGRGGQGDKVNGLAKGVGTVEANGNTGSRKETSHQPNGVRSPDMTDMSNGEQDSQAPNTAVDISDDDDKDEADAGHGQDEDSSVAGDGYYSLHAKSASRQAVGFHQQVLEQGEKEIEEGDVGDRTNVVRDAAEGVNIPEIALTGGVAQDGVNKERRKRKKGTEVGGRDDGASADGGNESKRRRKQSRQQEDKGECNGHKSDETQVGRSENSGPEEELPKSKRKKQKKKHKESREKRAPPANGEPHTHSHTKTKDLDRRRHHNGGKREKKRDKDRK